MPPNLYTPAPPARGQHAHGETILDMGQRHDGLPD
jgi:hypothetical protein